LGNPDVARAYKRIVRFKSPDVVFLLETKLKVSDPNVASK